MRIAALVFWFFGGILFGLLIEGDYVRTASLVFWLLLGLVFIFAVCGPRLRGDEPPQCPEPAQAPCRLMAFDDYNTAYAAAKLRRCPLVVWVGQQPQPMPGCVSCYQASYDGVQAPAVVLNYYQDGELWWRADVPGKPSVQVLLGVLYPPAPPTMKPDSLSGSALVPVRNASAPRVLRAPSVRASC